MQKRADPQALSRLAGRLSVGLLVLFLSLPQVVLAQEGQSQIRGRVESDSGQVPSQALITIVGPGDFRADTVPDREGYYRFSAIGLRTIGKVAEGSKLSKKTSVFDVSGCNSSCETCIQLRNTRPYEQNTLPIVGLDQPSATNTSDSNLGTICFFESRKGADSGAEIKELDWGRQNSQDLPSRTFYLRASPADIDRNT